MRRLQKILLFFIFFVFVNSMRLNAEPISKVHDFSRNGIALFLEQHYDPDFVAVYEDILLIHGLTYSSHEFDVDYFDYSITDFLVQNGFSVWQLDIAGYGRSGAVSNGFLVDSEYASNDILAAIEYIRKQGTDDKIDLLGWSWGTVTTSLAVAEHPEWIEALILYAPLFRGFDGAPPSKPWHKNSWRHAAGDFQKTSDGKINTEIAEIAVAAMFLSNAWKYDGETSPNGGRKDLMVGMDHQLIDLKKLHVPILLIGGTKDPNIYWDIVSGAVGELQRSERVQLVKIDGGSHILMLEKPYYRRFQREVLKFLRTTVD